jgi:hypothetical protein
VVGGASAENASMKSFCLQRYNATETCSSLWRISLSILLTQKKVSQTERTSRVPRYFRAIDRDFKFFLFSVGGRCFPVRTMMRRMLPRGGRSWYTNVNRLAQLPGPLEGAHNFNTDILLIYRSTTDGTTHHDRNPSHNLQRDDAHTTPTLYDALHSLCTGRRYSPTLPIPRVRISRALRDHPKYGLELHNHRWSRNPHPTRGSSSEPHGISPCCRYGMVASTLVAAQHWVTILLGRSVGGAGPGFTNRQHIAVHFCLVFYAITELEFYRAYTLFETFETYTDLLKYLPLANVNPSFPYCREPICYMTDLPNSWRCYLDGGNDPTTFWAIAFSKSHNVLFASHLLFHLVWRLANYPLKKIVNPAPEYDSYSAIVNGPILFGTYPASVWEVLLGLALLRVVRQANYVGFWAVVRLLERTRGR